MKNLNEILNEKGIFPSQTIETYLSVGFKFDHDVTVIKIARESGLRSGDAAGTHDGIRDGASLAYRVAPEAYSIYSLDDKRIKEVLENEGIIIPEKPEKPAWLVDAEENMLTIKQRLDGSYFYKNCLDRTVDLPQKFEKTELFELIFS